MKIEIESNSQYGINSNNYTVKIEKDKQDILNEENLNAINQTLSQAYHKSSLE